MEAEKKIRKRTAGYFISSGVLIFAVALCTIACIQFLTKGYVSVFGYSTFRVATGSMEPTIPVGALLVCKKTPIEEIEVGDIVCFISKDGAIRGHSVTHRVVRIDLDGNGSRRLETRGDANVSSDAYYADRTNLIGRVVWYTGKESFFTDMMSFLSGNFGFLALIVFPILLIAGLILGSSVRKLQRHIEESMAEYERMRGPIDREIGKPEREKVLPGFETLTDEDLKEAYKKVEKELLDEIHR